MPNTNTIQPKPAPVAEPTESERFAKQLVGDSDLALDRLVSAVQTNFELLWGTKDNPRPKNEAQAILDALGATDAAAIFARHDAVVTMLVSANVATFEPWETVPAYAVDANFVLGDLAPEWAA